MTCTIAPQPLRASLSTAFSRDWEIVSNRSSGSCKQWKRHTLYASLLESKVETAPTKGVAPQTQHENWGWWYLSHCTPMIWNALIELCAVILKVRGPTQKNSNFGGVLLFPNALCSIPNLIALQHFNYTVKHIVNWRRGLYSEATVSLVVKC